MKIVKLFLILMLLSLVSCRVGKPASNNRVLNQRGTLVVEIYESSDCVDQGGTVHLRGSVTNRGQRIQEIDSGKEPALDLQVGGGPAVFRRWSDGKALAPDLTRIKLQPGEAKEIEMDWTVPKDIHDGPVSVATIFRYDDRSEPIVAGWTLNVGTCPGPFP